MIHEDDDNIVGLPPPRTWVVLALLAVASLLVSWLAAFGLSGALVRAQLLNPFPPGHDPRPLWCLELFLGLLASLILLAGLFRWLSRRQLERIDQMMQE